MGGHVHGLAAVGAAIAVGFAASCGGSEASPEEIAADRSELVLVLGGAIDQHEQRAARQRLTACRVHVERAVGLLAKKPHTWDGSLEFGPVDVDTYRTRVDDLDTEIGRIPRGSLRPECLRVLRTLTAAAAIHKQALNDWTECIFDYGIYCRSTISLCATNNPPRDLCEETNDLSNSFQISLDLIRSRAKTLLDDWKQANTKLRAAQRQLDTLAVPSRVSPDVPRSQQAVAASVFGRAVDYMCSGEGVPSDAVEACQNLRDVLVQGVAEEEEQDLNTAVRGVLEGYELLPQEGKAS